MQYCSDPKCYGQFYSFALWILAACSTDEESTPIDDNDTEETEDDATDSEAESTEDEALTDQLLDEEDVLGGQVYLQDDMMIGTIMLDADLEDSVAEELAERYAEEIKAQYPELAVNVRPLKTGKMLPILY